jgi:hypothetical protein
MMNRNTSREKKKRMMLSEAAIYLGTSPAKLSRMIRRGELSYSVDPLDLRRKLVATADLKRLKEKSLLAQGED